MAEIGQTVEIDLSNLTVSKFNVRRTVGDISELADSIRQVGVLQPILVRPVDGKFEVIIGARRYTAAKLAGLRSIPAIVKELRDDEALIESLSENIQRGDLTEEEIASTYSALYNLDPGRWTQRAFAERIGKSVGWVGNLLAAVQTLNKLRETGFRGGIKAYPTREERAAGILPVSHLQEVEQALRSEEVRRKFSESDLEQKRLELVESIKDLDYDDAKGVIDRFKMYPDKSLQTVKDEALARKTGVSFKSYLPPSTARDVDRLAEERGRSFEEVVPELIERGLGATVSEATVSVSREELELAKPPQTMLDVGFRLESTVLDLAGELDPLRLERIPQGQKLKIAAALHILIEKIERAYEYLTGKKLKEMPGMIEGEAKHVD